MQVQFDSKVEQHFFERSGMAPPSTLIPYILVDNFPLLGLIASLRFLEWVSENPSGVVSLPTGKTPEYFIKYTQYLLQNWNTRKGRKIREEYGLVLQSRPVLNGLQFVQMDEFYPISPTQHNSYLNFVERYYINGFGFNPNKALLINSFEIPLEGGKNFMEVFPDSIIDLSLRYREASSPLESLQQKSIFKIDEWCMSYEEKIREKGGLGFFLGGIGPDGHIAFNIRGSDHHSSTRLTSTNFETQAVAANDLGGIEISRNRLVITIGLETITHNPHAIAIIFAAGESKAEIVKKSIESQPGNLYPATALQQLKNCRFYLTGGAACRLKDLEDLFYMQGMWTHSKTERAVIELCRKQNKYGHHLTLEDLMADDHCRMIPGLNEHTVQSVINSMKNKLARGIVNEKNHVIYHTGPHHDDIMLGLMPYTNRQVRDASNSIHFAVLTSGFTSVTNKFVIDALTDTLRLIEAEKVQMINYSDFFEVGYRQKWDKDVYHFLDATAERNIDEKRRGLCHRMVRAVVEINRVRNKSQLVRTLTQLINDLKMSYDGSMNPPKVQKLKGMIREFEEELVWAHYGVPVKNIHHLRLGFYKGDLFSDTPEKIRDILPILEHFRKYRPSVLSMAMDPEASGPDTHYKVLQAIASAVKEWEKEEDLSQLRIIGYRNVWNRFHPAEADIIIPVSLNAFDILLHSFSECYMSQVNASFPSYEYDGKFSEFIQKVWVEQLRAVQLLLGKNFFYQNEHPLLRATHGLIFARVLNVEEFLSLASQLERVTEGASGIPLSKLSITTK